MNNVVHINTSEISTGTPGLHIVLQICNTINLSKLHTGDGAEVEKGLFVVVCYMDITSKQL